jgi:hypothetical protein
VGFTFDQLESVCACAKPLDNCYPIHLMVVDMLVDVLFWCGWRVPRQGRGERR